MGQLYPYYKELEENIVATMNFLELDRPSYYYVFTKTLDLSNVK